MEPEKVLITIDGRNPAPVDMVVYPIIYRDSNPHRIAK